MALLLIFAFISGLVTILAPCIWPLLPIVLSSSVAGGSTSHKRPLGIVLGIMISFAVFTLTISFLVKLFNIDPNIFRIFAVIIIGFLGLTMVIPYLSIRFDLFVTRLTNLFGITRQTEGSGFMSGFITGLSLGIVWSPCAGPILAAIATLAATDQVSFGVILVTIAYVIGVGIPLFAFAYGGQQFITKSKRVSKYTGKIQRVFGVVMILTALAIYTHFDTYIGAKLLDAVPIFSQTLNKFEGNSLVTEQLNKLKGISTNSQIDDPNALFNTPQAPAPDFTGGSKWLNPEKPLTINELKGKVVLVDFWTYTCINCIRTLPHVTSWYDKYKDNGFVVIGVHTPEFQFEHDTANVLNAIKQYNIKYPVVQDNEYAIWNNYNNQYWPAEYLIDTKGNIRRVHFGEGEYDKMEMAIQTLLKEAGKKVDSSLETMPDQTPKISLSPETYLGAKRMEFYYPSGSTGEVVKDFTLWPTPPENSFSLGGNWTIEAENAVTGKNSVLNYNFNSDKVFLVLRPVKGVSSKFKVYLDGKLVDNSNKGQDVKNGTVTIDSDRLYNLIDLKGNPGNHILKLDFENQGIEVFAFTFG